VLFLWGEWGRGGHLPLSPVFRLRFADAVPILAADPILPKEENCKDNHEKLERPLQ